MTKRLNRRQLERRASLLDDIRKIDTSWREGENCDARDSRLVSALFGLIGATDAILDMEEHGR